MCARPLLAAASLARAQTCSPAGRRGFSGVRSLWSLICSFKSSACNDFPTAVRLACSRLLGCRGGRRPSFSAHRPASGPCPPATCIHQPPPISSASVKNLATLYAFAADRTLANDFLTSKRCCNKPRQHRHNHNHKPRPSGRDNQAYLLPQPENLEALKVAQLAPPAAARAPLRPGAGVPLLLQLVLFHLLLDGAGAGRVGDAWHDNVREGDVLEGGGVAGDGLCGVGGGAVDEDLWVAQCVSGECFAGMCATFSHECCGRR